MDSVGDRIAVAEFSREAFELKFAVAFTVEVLRASSSDALRMTSLA